MLKITKHYVNNHSVINNYKKIRVLTGVEFPPQRRTIFYYYQDYDINSKTYYQYGERLTKTIDFPYIQFIICESFSNINGFANNPTLDLIGHYISFSDESLAKGGKRYCCKFPNINYGYCCLGNDHLKYSTLEAYIDRFWRTSFVIPVLNFNDNNKEFNPFNQPEVTSADFPNLWDDNEHYNQVTFSWYNFLAQDK